uniref:30S ribosomal protein S11 n=1 Tax=Ascaris lumbricoides TaxID=6252 RepID=A0A0M3I7X0_ASCLU
MPLYFTTSSFGKHAGGAKLRAKLVNTVCAFALLLTGQIHRRK